MHSLDFLYDLIGQYGLYAVFLLALIEGDITLLLAGVLAHSGFFGEYSFARVLLWGTLGGCLSDNIAYLAGRGFRKSVREFRFYRASKPRIERLTTKFGSLTICDFQRLGKVLLVIVVLGIVAFYLVERLWLSKKVEEADPERLQEFEQAAQERLHDLRQEFQGHIPFKQQRHSKKKKALASKRGDADGD